jgi:hypothetical protein
MEDEGHDTQALAIPLELLTHFEFDCPLGCTHVLPLQQLGNPHEIASQMQLALAAVPEQRCPREHPDPVPQRHWLLLQLFVRFCG